MSAVLVLKPVEIRKGPLEIQLASTSSAIPQNNNADQVEDHHSKRSIRRSRYRQGSKGENLTLALSSPICPRTHDENPAEKILRLEGNLHFLTENYQQMLSGLHREIQSLISRNQELQFQLVTGLTMKLDVKDDHEEVANARNTKLKNQISGLRKDVEQLRQALRDANDRNIYYKNLVEELKQQSKPRGLFGTESKDEVTGPVASRSTNRFSQNPVPAATRFKEYEDTIQSLRKENDVLKEELIRQERERKSGPRRRRCSTRLPRIDTFPGRQYTGN